MRTKYQAEVEAIGTRQFPMEATFGAAGEPVMVLGPADRFSPYKEDLAARKGIVNNNQLMAQRADGQQFVTTASQLMVDGVPLIEPTLPRRSPSGLERLLSEQMEPSKEEEYREMQDLVGEGFSDIDQVTPPETVQPVQKEFGFVSEQDYLAAQAALKEKTEGLKVGVDITALPELIKIGVYHIQQGATSFSSWAKGVRQQHGEGVEKNLKQAWTLARQVNRELEEARRIGRPVTEEDLIWKRWTPTPDKGGKLRSGPEWVTGPATFKKMIAQGRQLVMEGISQRYWFRKSARAALRMLGDDPIAAERFTQLQAIYSAHNNLWGNTLAPVKAWSQWKRGVPRGEFHVGTGEQDLKAIKVLYDNGVFEGRKTNSFYLNLMHEVMALHPETDFKFDAETLSAIRKPVTVDVWVLRALGFRKPVAASGDITGGRDKYSFAENSVRRIHGELNSELEPGGVRWEEPLEAQAALWSAIKARMELPSVIEASNKVSEKQGLIQRTGTTVRHLVEDHSEYWWNRRQAAMKVSSDEAIRAVEETGRDFSDNLDRMNERVTLEAVPSDALGKDINQASTDVRTMFTEEARHLIVDENGNDVIAQKLGVHLNWHQQGTGTFEREVNPNWISNLLPAKGAGAFSRAEVDLYTIIAQFIFRQKVVPWFRPDNALRFDKPGGVPGAVRVEQQFRLVRVDAKGKEKLISGTRRDTLEEIQALQAERGVKEEEQIRGGKFAEGVDLTFDRPLTIADQQIILDRLNRVMPDSDFTKVGPDTISVINFRGDTDGVPFARSDGEFEIGVAEFLEDYRTELGIKDDKLFWSEGRYGKEQDWTNDPRGSEIEAEVGQLGRSDLLPWIRDRGRAYDTLLNGRYSGPELAAREAEAIAARTYAVETQTAEPEVTPPGFLGRQAEAAQARRAQRGTQFAMGLDPAEGVDAAIIAAEKIARAVKARKEVYKRLLKRAKGTGKTLDATAREMGVPLKALERLRAEAEVSLPTLDEDPETVSIRNAAVDQELEKMGLPPATHGQKFEFEQALIQADTQIRRDPATAQKLIDSLIAAIRPISKLEDAILVHEQTRLTNERIEAETVLNEARQYGTEADVTEAYNRKEKAIADFATLADVATQAGTENALGLSFRRMMLKLDFSLARMTRTKQAANKGQPLSKEQLAQVAKLQAEIEKTQKEFEAYQKESSGVRSKLEAELVVSRLAEEAAATRPELDPHIQNLARRIMDRLGVEAEAAEVRVRQRLSRIAVNPALDPAMIADLAIIGAERVARMGKDFGRWSKTMVDDFGDVIQPYLDAAWAASNKVVDERIGVMPERVRRPVGRAIKEKPSLNLFEQRQGVKDRIKEKAEAGDDNITHLAQQLARSYIEEGVRGRDNIVAAVQRDLSDAIPGITTRQTQDAISGYGNFTPLSTDEIDVILRDTKGQLQQVSKLEDLEAQQPPLRTGKERRTPSDEERRLIQQVEELKKKYNIQTTDPTRQLKSTLDARKTYVRHQIADLELQIATRERIVKERTLSPTDPELEALKTRRDVLKTEFETVFGRRKLTDQQRVAMSMRAVARSILDLEQRIKDRDIAPRTRAVPVQAPELDSLRAIRDALREQLQELRDAINPKKTPEQVALQSLKTRLKNQRADMLDRLQRGDFTKKERRTVELDEEAQRLSFEALQAKKRWYEALWKDRLANRTTTEKVVGRAGEMVNTSRAILTSLDLSAVGRQGGFIGLGHPVRASKSFPAMFRALMSEKGQADVTAEIEGRANFTLYKRSGLFLAEMGQTLIQMEEAYMSRWAEKIPLVAASQRAYVTFLNKLRADSFDAMVAGLSTTGKPTQIEMNAIANYVNVSTGRGAMTQQANAGALLSTVFFAPRNTISRFQLLAGQPFYSGTGRTRSLIAKDYARFLLGVGVVYGLAQMAGAEVDLDVWDDDHLSSDFGKIRWGNTRIDPLAGLLQATVFMSRIASGKTKTLKGVVRDIRGDDVPYGGTKGDSLIWRFLRTKLSPVVGTGINLITGENVVGDKATTTSTAKSLAMPLAVQDIYEAMLDQGAAKGAAMGLLAILGFGLQSFPVGLQGKLEDKFPDQAKLFRQESEMLLAFSKEKDAAVEARRKYRALRKAGDRQGALSYYLENIEDIKNAKRYSRADRVIRKKMETMARVEALTTVPEAIKTARIEQLIGTILSRAANVLGPDFKKTGTDDR